MDAVNEKPPSPVDEIPEDGHQLVVTYEVDGQVIKRVRRGVAKEYVWYLRGNSSWREW